MKKRSGLKKSHWIGLFLALFTLGLSVGLANYDGTRLHFFIYKKKQKACKEALCPSNAPSYQAIRLNSHSPDRYRCTGVLKVSVTTEGNTIEESIRLDHFVNPNTRNFLIRKYTPGQELSNLNTNGVDCYVM